MRILFVTANRLGDAVLSTGVLARLLDENPGARATVVCGPVAAPLFAALPAAERVIAMQKRRWSRHWFDLWGATVGYLWDVVVDLRASALAYLVPARQRFVLRKDDSRRHRLFLLAETLGWSEPAPPRLWLAAAHRDAGARLLPAGAPIVALGPTANWPGKEWPLERFVDLAQRLTATSDLGNARFAVFGGPDARERTTAVALTARLPAERTVDLAGRIDLPTVAACLARCALYVGNDSGLMHLAAAAATPTLGMFGPSDEALYAPWGDHCNSVRTPESYAAIVGAPGYDYRSTATHMTSLAVEPVAAAALDLYRRTATRRSP
jgi:ADP-heptose:LPS heptosyltransferase